MKLHRILRRDFLKTLGAGAMAFTSPEWVPLILRAQTETQAPPPAQRGTPPDNRGRGRRNLGGETAV